MHLLIHVVTITSLIAVLTYYRVPQKAWRRIMVEKRVPGVSESHQQNRNYDSNLAIFREYDREGVRIVVFGDSLVADVAWNELLGRNDIANRGIDGDDSAGLLNRVEMEKGLSPGAAVFLIGTNDILRGIPPAVIVSNIEETLRKAEYLWPKASLLVVSIPGFAEWVERAEERNRAANEVNIGLRRISSEREFIDLVDLASILRPPGQPLRGEATTDGVHLSASGYRAVREILEGKLATAVVTSPDS